MDNLTKQYCYAEKQVSKEQFLTDIYLLIKGEYIAKTHCNGEYISVELLNGQKFKIKVEG